MASSDRGDVARDAARARLRRVQLERAAILAAFPELRLNARLQRTRRRAGSLMLPRTTPRRSSA